MERKRRHGLPSPGRGPDTDTLPKGRAWDGRASGPDRFEKGAGPGDLGGPGGRLMCGAGPGDLGGSRGSISAEGPRKTRPKISSQTAFTGYLKAVWRVFSFAAIWP